MKKLLFASIFTLLLINFQSVAQPKIVASEESYDFGEVVQGNKVEHNFIFTNTGDQELKIEKVKASCGCTAASPNKDVLQPGEEAVVKVAYNTAVQSVGSKRKFVYVFSNDPENPQLRVQFTAVVVARGTNPDSPAISIDKDEYDFGTVTEGQIVDANFQVKNNGKEDLVVKDVSSSCGCTVAMLGKKTLKGGEETTLKIEFDSKNRSGKMTRTVTLYTNDPVKPERTILLYANVVEGNE